jgi:hypothetical protein
MRTQESLESNAVCAVRLEARAPNDLRSRGKLGCGSSASLRLDGARIAMKLTDILPRLAKSLLSPLESTSKHPISIHRPSDRMARDDLSYG